MPSLALASIGAAPTGTIFHYIYPVLHYREYRRRYDANLRREQLRIPFVGATPKEPNPTLSSRARQDDSLANHPAESRDPVLADTQQRPKKEFSARTSPGGVRDENSSMRYEKGQADTGSFDSVTGGASASSHSAQDDRAGVGSDLDVFARSSRPASASPKFTSITSNNPNTR